MTARAKIHALKCRECGTEFMAIRHDAQFCGRSHAMRYVQRTVLNSGRRKQMISNDVIQRAVDLVNAGLAWHKAAKEVGIDITSLRKRAVKLGLPVRRGLRGSRLVRTLDVPTDERVLAYIAAMIDGEGSVQMYQGKRMALTVHIYNTSLELMEWLAAIGGVYAPRPTPPHRKQSYEWRIKGRDDTLALLMAVEPFMIIKKNKARTAIQFLQKEISKNYLASDVDINGLLAAMKTI